MNVRESEAVNTVLRYLFQLPGWEGYLSEQVVESAQFLAERANNTLQAGVRSSEIPETVPR